MSFCSSFFFMKKVAAGPDIDPSQLEKLLRSGVREAGVSRCQGGPIEGPLKPLVTSQQYGTEGLQGVCNCAPFIDAQSLSDKCPWKKVQSVFSRKTNWELLHRHFERLIPLGIYIYIYIHMYIYIYIITKYPPSAGFLSPPGGAMPSAAVEKK